LLSISFRLVSNCSICLPSYFENMRCLQTDQVYAVERIGGQSIKNARLVCWNHNQVTSKVLK